MIDKLTHTEACALVEESLERVSKTLAYVRLKLEEIRNSREDIDFYQSPCRSWKVKALVDEANLLCNINWYGAYLHGARAMYRAMVEHRLLNLPTVKGKKMASDAVKPTPPHDTKAMLDLMMESTRNLEWFLQGWPDGIELFISHEHDRKGKVVGAKARFARKVTKYEEIC